jgi:hypothetical protein
LLLVTSHNANTSRQIIVFAEFPISYHPHYLPTKTQTTMRLISPILLALLATTASAVLAAEAVGLVRCGTPDPTPEYLKMTEELLAAYEEKKAAAETPSDIMEAAKEVNIDV